MSFEHTPEQLIAQWPVQNASSVVVAPQGGLWEYGDQSRTYPLASVTKLLATYAALIAVEEGAISLEDSAGPQGSTVRHLLAHSAGYDFDTQKVRAAPGERRLYSNTDFEVLAAFITQATEIEFGEYARLAVFEPLGMNSTDISASAAAGGISSAHDLARFAHELLTPTLIDSSTMQEATTVQYPGIDGLVPGFGRHKPNDWGLGFEIRSHKSPHWTAASANPRTFGHFGQSGTFLWVDPVAQLACVALTDRPFGPWAAEVWPPFNESVLETLGR